MRAGMAAVKRNAWYCKFSASQCPLPTPSKWSTSIRWCKDQQCHLKQSHCWRECNEPRSVQWKCQVSIMSRKNWHILLHLGIQSCKYSHTHVSQNYFTGAHGITHKLLKKKKSLLQAIELHFGFCVVNCRWIVCFTSMVISTPQNHWRVLDHLVYLSLSRGSVDHDVIHVSTWNHFWS